MKHPAIIAFLLSFIYSGIQTGKWLEKDNLKVAGLVGLSDYIGLLLTFKMFPETLILGDSRVLPSIIAGGLYAGSEKYFDPKDKLLNDFAYGTVLSGISNVLIMPNVTLSQNKARLEDITSSYFTNISPEIVSTPESEPVDLEPAI
ncbi:MAG TPA: hypothetical protein PKI46_02610 [Bacteroidales bacterium]|nr:hypothetical protein [Bacteroidales bacterium]